MTRKTLASLIGAATLALATALPAYAIGPDDRNASGDDDEAAPAELVLPPQEPIPGVPAMSLELPDGCTEWIDQNADHIRGLYCEATVPTPSGEPIQRSCGNASMDDIVAGFVGPNNPLRVSTHYKCEDVGDLNDFAGFAIGGLCPGADSNVCRYTGGLDLSQPLAGQTPEIIIGGRVFGTENEINSFHKDQLVLDKYIVLPAGVELSDVEIAVAEFNEPWGSYDAGTGMVTVNFDYSGADADATAQELGYFLNVEVRHNDHVTSGQIPVVAINRINPDEVQTVEVEVPGPERVVEIPVEVIREVPAEPEPLVHPWSVRVGAIGQWGPESGDYMGGIAALKVPLAKGAHPFYLVPSLSVGSRSLVGVEDSTVPGEVEHREGTNYAFSMVNSDGDVVDVYNHWSGTSEEQINTTWYGQFPERITEGQVGLYLGFPELRSNNRRGALYLEAGPFLGLSQKINLSGTEESRITDITTGSLIDENGTLVEVLGPVEQTRTGYSDVLTQSRGGIHGGIAGRACAEAAPYVGNSADVALHACADFGYGSLGGFVGGEVGATVRFDGPKKK